MIETTVRSDVRQPRPLVILIGWGVLLWAAGVVLLRWLVSIDALHGTPQLIAYALVIVGTAPLIPLTPRLAGLPRTESFAAIAVPSLTALLIDGIVIGYAPWIYASDPEQARACAGALLWGVGVALALGLAMQPRAR